MSSLERFVPISFSYGDVETVLARLNRIADDKRVAFRARLKHFQRLGFPEGVNTGTGRRAAYTFENVLQLALATELTQAGMAPKRIIRILDGNWNALSFGLLIAMSPQEYLDRWEPAVATNDVSLVLSPEAMRELTEEGEGEYDYYESIDVINTASLSDFISKEREGETPIVGEWYRHFVLHLHDFTMVLLGLIVSVRPDCTPIELLRCHEELISARQEEMTRAGAEIRRSVENRKAAENAGDT